MNSIRQYILETISEDKSPYYNPETRRYWDAHLEHNQLRLHPDTDAGAMMAYIIEDLGDLLREITGDTSYQRHYSMGYKGLKGYAAEKYLRAQRNIEDSFDSAFMYLGLSREDNQRIEKMKSLVLDIPSTHPVIDKIKNALYCVLNVDRAGALAALDEVGELLV